MTEDVPACEHCEGFERRSYELEQQLVSARSCGDRVRALLREDPKLRIGLPATFARILLRLLETLEAKP